MCLVNLTGLKYLNARFFDPKLGQFTSADWWDVRQAGVGTNRYAYSGNDPINAMDPGGNATAYETQYGGVYVGADGLQVADGHRAIGGSADERSNGSSASDVARLALEMNAQGYARGNAEYKGTLDLVSQGAIDPGLSADILALQGELGMSPNSQMNYLDPITLGRGAKLGRDIHKMNKLRKKVARLAEKFVKAVNLNPSVLWGFSGKETRGILRSSGIRTKANRSTNGWHYVLTPKGKNKLNYASIQFTKAGNPTHTGKYIKLELNRSKRIGPIRQIKVIGPNFDPNGERAFRNLYLSGKTGLKFTP